MLPEQEESIPSEIVSTSMLPPEKERNSHHIPPEIMEEILVNLPVKSLLRFSCVSKSWNSMIFDSRFIRRHKSRAPHRGRILISHSPSGSLHHASTHSLSSLVSSKQAVDYASPLICPFKGVPEDSDINLVASCDELLCVEHVGSLFLWNPSMRTYRKLPHPSVSAPTPSATFSDKFCFGIGYDSVGDDYKILKIREQPHPVYDEVYSLRSNSWKKIESFPACVHRKKGVFVNGALHWMAYRNYSIKRVIISFDLSTEEYAEVAQPPYHLAPRRDDTVELCVLSGMLCVNLNYCIRNKFCFWVMREYGKEKSWNMMYEIRIPVGLVEDDSFTPLCYYDKHTILVKVKGWKQPTALNVYVNSKDHLPQIVFRCSYDEQTSGHLYVESLVSPATYCSPQPLPERRTPTAVAVAVGRHGDRRRRGFFYYNMFWFLI